MTKLERQVEPIRKKMIISGEFSRLRDQLLKRLDSPSKVEREMKKWKRKGFPIKEMIVMRDIYAERVGIGFN